MKTIEEKAKAYDEALKAAIAAHKDEDRHLKATLERIFPELQESEDERIRKGLIKALSSIGKRNWGGIDVFESISWLEKQGEQKPANNVEPKFKVGDWIVWQNKCYKVNYNGCGYELNDQNGLSTSLEYGTVDKSAHLWTIKNDAKDGDVLASELCDSIILFRGIKDNNVDFYCDYDFSKIDIPGDRFSINDGQHYGDVEDSKDFHPATKEQHDLLFSKMYEAGYEWDAEKKELKKIEQKSDEYSDTERQEMFIKSQRPHFWRPSDEQMKALSEASGIVGMLTPRGTNLQSLYNDLKKLREGEL